MKEKKVIVICIFFLGVISIINMYNARYLNSYYNSYFFKQLLWYFICNTIFFIINKIHFKSYFKYSCFFYYINTFLLIWVLLFGRTINGAKAWINIGLLSFQPSEIMKISLNLLLINIATRNISKKEKLFKMTFYTFIPSLLVFLEPDTGAIIFYIIIFLVCSTLLKNNYKFYIFIVIISFIIGTFIIYLYMNNRDILIKILGTSIFYRADRIINFKRNNYQHDLAMLSIFGSNIFQFNINHILIYVPEGATDFILAFIVGNFGIIIIFVILFIYLILLTSLLNISKYTQDKKTNFLIISFVYMTLIQIIINIGMNIGLLPIIGITLPFLSYGGSSLLICYIYIGIIFKLTSKDN